MALARSIIFVMLLGILSHFVGELLPRKWFHDQKWPFKSFSWEKDGKIYEKLKIRQWKDKVPDMSKYMRRMVPKRLTKGADSGQMGILIKETCVAEFIHCLLCIFSVGVYFIWKNITGVFLTALCVLCNIPFILIQRYNRPHLQCIREKLLRREEHQTQCEC